MKSTTANDLIREEAKKTKTTTKIGTRQMRVSLLENTFERSESRKLLILRFLSKTLLRPLTRKHDSGERVGGGSESVCACGRLEGFHEESEAFTVL